MGATIAMRLRRKQNSRRVGTAPKLAIGSRRRALLPEPGSGLGRLAGSSVANDVCGHLVENRRGVSSEGGAAGTSEHAWVVLASFDSYRHAEHLFASLGRAFRKKARMGGTTAVVVRGNPDGSLKLTQSRVLTASGLASALIRISLSWTVGFMGLVSTLKGTKGTVHAAHVREGRVGSDEHAAHDMLAAVGPNAALALVRGTDPAMHQLVLHAAGEAASRCWDGSLAELLARLDPGSTHDWVRSALGEPPSTNS